MVGSTTPTTFVSRVVRAHPADATRSNAWCEEGLAETVMDSERGDGTPIAAGSIVQYILGVFQNH